MTVSTPNSYALRQTDSQDPSPAPHGSNPRRRRSSKKGWQPPNFASLLQLRAILSIGLGLVLVWLILTHSLAAYFAPRDPELALRLNSNESEALITIAERMMRQALSEALETQKANDRNKQGINKSVGSSPSDASTAADDAHARASLDASTEPRIVDGRLIAVPHVALSSDKITEIEAAAKRAFLAAPADARPLMILAQLADSVGDREKKSKLLHEVVRRTKHEPLADYWLMLEAAENRDYAATVNYADIMLRKFLEFDSLVMPVLARMVELKQGDQEVKTLLNGDPPWRSRFFNALLPHITDARTPLELLLSLKSASIPPTANEINNYLNFLMSKQLYDLAYYVWLQFLEPSQLATLTLVNNGSFERLPGGGAFDWSIPQSTGATVDIRTPSGEMSRALYIDLFGPGRVDLQPVKQILVLPPGNYRLTLKQKGEVTGRRGLQWTVSCASSATAIGQTDMLLGSISSWQTASATFTVPQENCRAQTLQLILAARSASEQLVKGTAWFDEILIVRE